MFDDAFSFHSGMIVCLLMFYKDGINHMKIKNRYFWFLIGLCLLTGVGIHLSLIFRSPAMLSDRPFRDDGFYALTVSRNLATGNGLSVSNGEIATNGIQPLFVYLCSLPYFMTQDRLEAIRLVQALNFIIHILSTTALFFLVRLITGMKRASWIAAALWMVSYNILKLSSNGLETGLYLFMLIGVSYYYFKLTGLDKLKLFYSFLFGVLLGLTTLTRIDAGILCIALALHYAWLNRKNGLISILIRGPFFWLLGWLCITLPWWLYNIDLAGSPLPTSGLVQTMNHTTSSLINFKEYLVNFWYALHVVLDNLLFIIITPLRLIKIVGPVSVAILVIKLLSLFAVLYVLKKNWNTIKLKSIISLRKLTFFPIFLTGLLIFYIFFFNVEWYMNRYLVPFSIASVVLLAVFLDRLKAVYTYLVLTLALVFTILISGYSYNRVFNTMYTYHWGWVRENVSEDTWVASSQSGTLGYFHDRTINTDGKVNSELISVLPGQMGTYLASRDVQYFLEWEKLLFFGTVVLLNCTSTCTIMVCVRYGNRRTVI